MTTQDLARIVATGEGPHLEFKRRVPQPKRVVKEIVAFANTDGGRLLLGVDDDGSLVGVKDADEEVFALNAALEEHASPAVDLEMERVPVSRKREIIVVHIPGSRAKPHFVVDGAGVKTAYVRVMDRSVEASKEAVRMMRHADSGKQVTFEFGDKELLLMRYLDEYGRITVNQFAQLAGIPRRNASHTLVLLTKAELLALHPSDKEDFFTIAPRRRAGQVASSRHFDRR